MYFLRYLGLALVVLLSGCVNKGILEAKSPYHETFSVEASQQATLRRAQAYVRNCFEQVKHKYDVVYLSRVRRGEKGAGDEILVYKQTEPAKILASINIVEQSSASRAQVTVTVLGAGRWDAAEVAAAKASIQSATPSCRVSIQK
jgi:hypothetical protein